MQTILEQVVDDLKANVVKSPEEMETFFQSGAAYAARNIKPEILKIAGDSLVAADKELAGSDASGTERLDMALKKAEEAALKDNLEFLKSDFLYSFHSIIHVHDALVKDAADSIKEDDMNKKTTG